MGISCIILPTALSSVLMSNDDDSTLVDLLTRLISVLENPATLTTLSRTNHRELEELRDLAENVLADSSDEHHKVA
jgi:hypothetical protein